MKTRLFSTLAAALLGAALCLSQQVSDPWPDSALIEPAALASVLQSSAAKPPTILCVAFPVLYRSKHIQHAVYAGQGSKPEGIEALNKAVTDLPKDSDIVIYCGCCPMEKCPNVRPAYRSLQEMGFTHVRVLRIPMNMQTDWYAKNYPTEAGTGDAAPAAR